MRFPALILGLLMLLAAPATITGPSMGLYAEEPATEVVVDAPAPATATVDDVAPAPAEEPAAEATSEEGGGWMAIVGTIFAFIISACGVWVTKYFGGLTAAKAEEARAKAAADGISKLQQMRYIGEAELYTAVNELNATEMPKLIEMAGDGKITKDEAKAFLKGLRDRAIDIAAKRLAAQGIDLVTDLGMDWVHGKIRQFVDEKSPFLGSTVDAIFSDNSRAMVSEYGEKLLGTAIDKLKGGDPAPDQG